MLRITVINLVIAFCLSIGIANAQNISDEAKRHFDRGQAAIEMAKTDMDYEDAIKEFEQAATFAPDWPDVYYNLGFIQEKVNKYDDAVRNLKRYLELSPNASDAEMVKSTVNKIEYKKQKADEESKITSLLSGKWFANPGPNNYIRWPVQFIVEDGLVYFYAQTGMDADKGLSSPVFYNYQKVLVKREGRDVSFRVTHETLLRSADMRWTRDAQYNLKLIELGKLEGTVSFDGETRKARFWR